MIKKREIKVQRHRFFVSLSLSLFFFSIKFILIYSYIIFLIQSSFRYYVYRFEQICRILLYFAYELVNVVRIVTFGHVRAFHSIEIEIVCRFLVLQIHFIHFYFYRWASNTRVCAYYTFCRISICIRFDQIYGLSYALSGWLPAHVQRYLRISFSSVRFLFFFLFYSFQCQLLLISSHWATYQCKMLYGNNMQIVCHVMRFRFYIVYTCEKWIKTETTKKKYRKKFRNW